MVKEKPPALEPKPVEAVAETENDEKPVDVPPPPEPVAAAVRPTPNRPTFPPLQARRVEKPGGGVESLRPIPDLPVIEKHSLSELLDQPETFADRAVEPTGLYAIGRHSSRNHDGTVTIPVRRVTVHARAGNLAAHQQAESAMMMIADPVVARHLESLRVIRIDPFASRATPGEWGDNAAVLTLHVQKRMDSAAEEWVPTLKKIEFLVGINFLHVGEGKFHDSFRSLIVMPNDAEIVGLSPRHDWSTRLGVPYTQQLKHIVHNTKEENLVREMALLNRGLISQLGNVLRTRPGPPR